MGMKKGLSKAILTFFGRELPDFFYFRETKDALCGAAGKTERF